VTFLRRYAGALTIAAAIAAALPACGGSPTNPGPPSPSPSPNQAPVIESITASAERVEVDTDVTLAASVRDAETPVDRLVFEWAADVGTFTGQGPSVTWRAPADATTPADVVIRLTVRERYGTAPAGGQQPEHVVTGSSSPIRLHNSPRELGELAMRFLRDFANSSVSPESCVREFSDSCRGKFVEREQIEFNREHYQVLSSSLDLHRVSVAGDRMSGNMEVDCGFTSRITKCDATIRNCVVGGTESVSGDCNLSAVYEQNRWLLCSSEFRPGSTITPSMLRFFGLR
jgi:hypothetical protein